MISFLCIDKDELKGTNGYVIGNENLEYVARKLFCFSFMKYIPIISMDFEKSFPNDLSVINLLYLQLIYL